MVAPSRIQSLVPLTLIVIAVVTFLFAIQLLSEAMQLLSPAIRPFVHRRAVSGLQLIGTSWLAAYVLLNGSVVAAVALSLFSAELIGVPELFFSVVGSRLGAAGIVLVIGGLDFLRTREYSVSEATELGVLTFIVTHTIYVPAMVIGAVVIRWTERSALRDVVEVNPQLGGEPFFGSHAGAVIELIGTIPSVLLAFFLFVGSLHLLDQVVDEVDTSWLRERLFVQLQRRWVSVGLGFVVTAISTGVAFSMGVVVPLYNRGYIKRHEIVPYIMGASIGTLTDTLLVAIVLDSSAGVAVVLLLFGISAAIAGVALAFYGIYYAPVNALQERLLRDRLAFIAFLLSLVVVPVTLVLISHWY